MKNNTKNNSSDQPLSIRHASLLRPYLHSIVTVFVMLSANAYAQQPPSITLKGSAEVPPVVSAGSGVGLVVVLPDGSVSAKIKVSGFNPTVAHIHEAAQGENGPAIITLTKTSLDGFVVPNDTKLTDAQYKSYVAGKLYINVHSADYPNGEVRVQLMRPQTIARPEQNQ